MGRPNKFLFALALVGGMAVTLGNAATDVSSQPSSSAAAIADAMADALVFDGVTVVDVEQGRLIPSQRVVIVGNRIRTMGEAGKIAMPKQAQIVDARGKYLIPGLWDMHTHSQEDFEKFSKLFVANGITGVRDAASKWPLDSMIEWRRQVLAGRRIGPPRQLLSGHSIDENSACTRRIDIHICVANAADARHLVDSLKAAGADMLKTYALSPQMYFRIAAEARRAGIPFGGHTEVPGMMASDSGARIIDHSTLNRELVSHCLYQEASVERCRPIAEHFARNGTWWVPTWIFPPRIAGRAQSRSIYTQYDRFLRDFWRESTPLRSLHEDLQRAFAKSDSSSSRQKSSRSLVDSMGYMYVVRGAGLPVLAGTDTYDRYVSPGFALHAELATYVAEGMTPLEALQTATLNPAKFLRGTDSLGTVAAGKLADLVLLDANPLTDIVNTTAIRAVVANGRYFDRVELDRLLTEVRAKRVKVSNTPP